MSQEARLSRESEFMTLPQLAEFLNVSERTAWNYARTGISPPGIKFGSGKQSAMRYPRKVYLAWRDNGCPRISTQNQENDHE